MLKNRGTTVVSRGHRDNAASEQTNSQPHVGFTLSICTHVNSPSEQKESQKSPLLVPRVLENLASINRRAQLRAAAINERRKPRISRCALWISEGSLFLCTHTAFSLHEHGRMHLPVPGVEQTSRSRSLYTCTYRRDYPKAISDVHFYGAVEWKSLRALHGQAVRLLRNTQRARSRGAQCI